MQSKETQEPLALIRVVSPVMDQGLPTWKLKAKRELS
jgi:hypothetical protein